jgi:hypothetical protein
MKFNPILITLLFMTSAVWSQETVPNPGTTVSDVRNTNPLKVSQRPDATVKANVDMIRRFNECKTEGDIYSWSQLLINHESLTVQEYLLSYRNADFNEESLESIKLALEEKRQDVSPAQTAYDEDYLANINRIKQEISQKLGSGTQVAMK